MKKRKQLTIVSLLAALALLAGCTSASAVTLEEAKELVKEQVGDENAVVIEQDTDQEDGVYELEIILNGVAYEFEVDSRTGTVRSVEREEDLPRPTETAAITLDQARAIAYAHAGAAESEARDRSAERDDGVYEIEFDWDGCEYEYHISPSGEILHCHKEQEHHRDHSHSAHAGTQPPETAPAQSDRITGQEALDIALAHAGVSAPRDRDVEWDDGIWEVSFDADGREYEYHISPSGEILSSEQEFDD